ncbi:MAG: molybdopterin-binding protein [Cycloclasticus sp.]|nr:molybdopterin-binding protein [Cycloclasticus sp.]
MPNTTKPKAIIFSQGDEVITGALVDTNAAFLADHCRTLGFDIVRHITVADDMDDLVQVLQEIDGLADICLCTGGLGPTQDDLTTEAFAKAFQVELELDNEALAMMRDFFAKLKMPMADVNIKQAMLPQNSTRIDNKWGTAPGFTATGRHCRFYFMPGVPFEMKQMVDAFVLDDLQRQFDIEQPRLIVFRSMGMGESDIQQAVNDLSIASDIRISFRAGMPENELKLLFPASYSEQQIQQYINEVEVALRGSVFAVDGFDKSVRNLADCVDQLMREKQQSLSLIETVSQGETARQCQADWLLKSIVFPRVSDILSQPGMQQQSIDETAVIDIAQKEQAQGLASLTIAQLYKRVNDSTVTVYTAVANDQRCISSSKDVWGRTLRQQLVSSALAFNLLRKLLQDS